MDARSLQNLHIPGWMIFEMELNFSELKIYALILGYSQGKQGEFYGSQQYLADWCGITRQQAAKVLRKLVKKGLLQTCTEPMITEKGKVMKRTRYQAIIPNFI